MKLVIVIQIPGIVETAETPNEDGRCGHGESERHAGREVDSDRVDCFAFGSQ